MLTNIVTIRTYSDGTNILFINGKEIPSVLSVGCQHITEGVEEVTVTLRAAQFNQLREDEPAPPKKDIISIQVTADTSQAREEIQKLIDTMQPRPISVPTWVAYASYAMLVAICAIAAYAAVG